MSEYTPPLDLTALREIQHSPTSSPWAEIEHADFGALLDRLEASEAEASKYRGLYDEAESAHTDAEAKLAAVRELHQPFAWENVHGEAQTECTHCIGEYDGSVHYPCPTIRALDGEE